jgi:hypothetical protein
MTHLSEEQLIAYVVGDAPEGTSAATEAHAAMCERCRNEIEALRATLEATADSKVPERDDDYGARVWARVEPLLPARQVRPHGRVTVQRGWLAAAAVLLAIAGAFVAGRLSREARPATGPVVASTAPDQSTIRERVMLSALSEHFDRTEHTLLELVNAGGAGDVDISAEQVWARDLIDANRLYRQSASAAASPALTQLLDELEPVLLDIVHSPSHLSPDDFQVLRSRIEDRSLVFKLRVSGADVRARQRTLLPPGEKTS